MNYCRMDSKTLSRINSFIRRDIRVQLDTEEKLGENNKRDSNLRFGKYLVSVITHSIGVPASVRPFNTKQGYVLLYIMEVFKLSDLDLNDMFTTGNTTPTAAKLDQKHLFRCKKFHSWRPEIILRLSCPKQLEQTQLENLSIRVYLFKEDSTVKLDASGLSKLSPKVEKTKQIMGLIFSRFRLDPSIMIRPVNELRSLIKFKSTLVSVDEKQTNEGLQLMKKFSMACSYRNRTIMDDLRLPIRRHYCDSKVPYILRFEFWIDTRSRGRGCVNCIKSSFRAAVYNGICSSLKKKESIYMNEHSDFYGFINVKLSQMPSYPIQKTLDILSLQNKEIDSCEVISDIRNRQILETNQLYTTYPDSQIRKSNEEFLVNHIRLYLNCLLYHCKALTTYDIPPEPQEVTLDSLLYLPAHCLINQHRLQGNLSKIEDKCLRRISILLLLINLHDLKCDDQMKQTQIELICCYLIAIVQNEYLISHRPLDDKTAQDINLFESSPNKRKSNRTKDMSELELMIVDNFMRAFLEPRVTAWLSQPRDSLQDAANPLLFGGLRLLNSCLVYLKKCQTGRSTAAALQMNIRQIKSDFEAHLCSALLERLGRKMKQAIQVDKEGRKRRPRYSLWLQLLFEIKFINHNLCLNWSNDGIDGILERETVRVDTSTFFKSVADLESVIEVKLDEYLSR